ncbi:MAG: PAS domain-containing protein [Anaerolineales bacterium]|nr:PAS domain-containing protein [Anaerolineales bacterium]
MQFIFTPISVILFFTTVINLIAAYIGWQRKDTKGGLYFAWGMSGVALWTLAAGLGYAAVPIHLKIFFAKVDAIGYHSAITLFTLFVLSYAGYDDWLKKAWVKILFFAVPIFNLLLIWTNDWHGLIWNGFRNSTTAENVIIFEYGAWFSWITITNYVMILTLIITLWVASRRGSELSKRQARLLFLASIFPVVSNLVYLFGIGNIEGVDWTSLTFSISGILFLLALYGTRFLDLAPIARHIMIERMTDCVVVVDNQNRILDFNSAAQENFNLNQKCIGESLETVMNHWRALLEFLYSDNINLSQATIFYESQFRYFDINLTPLSDNRNQLYGKLIVFRDITKQIETEMTLQQKLSEIQTLNKNLQDTQAQLITHERTLAKLEERQRLGRDMHDSVNQSIHSLMLFSETLEVVLKKNEIEKAIEISKRIHESGQQSLKEIRLLVYETQSVLASQDNNLIRAIEERLNMVERRVGIKAEIICEDDFLAYYPPEWKENLYWIIIESLNNSLKHAQARSIKIMINNTEEQLDLEIIDDGIGFDINQIQSGGFGMRTMRERAEILNGQLQVNSSHGSGTRVCLKVKIGD